MKSVPQKDFPVNNSDSVFSGKCFGEQNVTTGSVPTDTFPTDTFVAIIKKSFLDTSGRGENRINGRQVPGKIV